MASSDVAERWTVATKTLFKDTPPIHRLPNEILSTIFQFAIYSTNSTHVIHISRENRVKAIYRHLYILFSVCSRWNKVISSNGSFWALLPVIELPSGDSAIDTARLSLQRAGGHGFSLVAQLNEDKPHIQDFIIETLTQYGPRFTAINLRSNSFQALIQSLAVFIDSTRGTQSLIKELSLCPTRSIIGPISRLSIPRPGSVDQRVNWGLDFKSLMEPLRVLRICQIGIDFTGMSLRMLTEIRLQSLSVRDGFNLSNFLLAISLSSQLRMLEVISVVDGVSDGGTSETQPFPISFPNLQHLYLEDLDHHTLIFMLGSIASGSHTVTLNWTRRCLVRAEQPHLRYTMLPNSDLTKFQIDVLMLRRERMLQPNGALLYHLLWAMPTIKTLYLDSLSLNLPLLEELVPTRKNGASSENEQDYKNLNTLGTFPKLKYLYISRSHLHDLAALRELSEIIQYHSLLELGLGLGLECDCQKYILSCRCSRRSQSDLPAPIIREQEELDSVMESFWDSCAISVPRTIRLAGNASEMPPTFGFESRVWQL